MGLHSHNNKYIYVIRLLWLLLVLLLLLLGLMLHLLMMLKLLGMLHDSPGVDLLLGRLMRMGLLVLHVHPNRGCVGVVRPWLVLGHLVAVRPVKSSGSIEMGHSTHLSIRSCKMHLMKNSNRSTISYIKKKKKKKKK